MHVQAHFNLGNVYRQCGQLEATERCYTWCWRPPPATGARCSTSPSRSPAWAALQRPASPSAPPSRPPVCANLFTFVCKVSLPSGHVALLAWAPGLHRPTAPSTLLQGLQFALSFFTSFQDFLAQWTAQSCMAQQNGLVAIAMGLLRHALCASCKASGAAMLPSKGFPLAVVWHRTGIGEVHIL